MCLDKSPMLPEEPRKKKLPGERNGRIQKGGGKLPEKGITLRRIISLGGKKGEERETLKKIGIQGGGLKERGRSVAEEEDSTHQESKNPPRRKEKKKDDVGRGKDQKTSDTSFPVKHGIDRS